MAPEKNEVWNAVDSYIQETLAPNDGVLAGVVEANSAAGLPNIDVTSSQGKLLHVLVLATKAKRVLEVGTLGGYSTIWLARALPRGGRLITLEREPKHAEVARANLKRAGLAKKVEIRLGAAVDSLAQMHAEGVKPFDLIFIDADKPNNPVYLDWALKLAKRGTLIVVDNVVRQGALADASSADESVVGTRAMFERMGSEPRLVATAIQTVGSKGYDGFAIGVVVSE
jgi:predicted O-methyltransferase YrrM